MPGCINVSELLQLVMEDAEMGGGIINVVSVPLSSGEGSLALRIMYKSELRVGKVGMINVRVMVRKVPFPFSALLQGYFHLGILFNMQISEAELQFTDDSLEGPFAMRIAFRLLQRLIV